MSLLEQDELADLGRSYQASLEKLAAWIFPPAEKKASISNPSAATPADPTKLAFARELLRLNAVTPGQALALGKYAEVSAEQARRSLDRLDSLERNKPTLGQAARYGAVGGLGGAAIGAIGHAVETGSPLKGATPKAKLLNVASNAVKGALGGGALPLVRTGLDRRAETNTLRHFMQENQPNA